MLKYLIEIDDIFTKEKELVKLSFKIILLTQDKKMIIYYIKDLLFPNIKDIENEIYNLNFNNPFSIIFIHELFKIIFPKKIVMTIF